MQEVARDLLILLAGIWIVAVTLRPLGLPTIMGELIVGVLLGPAVLGILHPSEAITLLAEIGIFFLMFHAGVETQPREFFDALKRSLGVAIVGAIVPFGVSFAVARSFGLDAVGATFVGLTMTATAVVVTLKSLKDLGLADTRVARVIVASCVIDDMLTLIFFGVIVGVLSGGSFEPIDVAFTLMKVGAFFVVSVGLGRYVYPRLSLPFRKEGGKGFTFILLVAFGAGLFAEAIGLHMILGAYVAGLFFEDKVAHPTLVRVVADRSYGIAYSFLGPIFFISLGFSVTFDLDGTGVAFIVLLTSAVIVGQISSAGGMALRMGMHPKEAVTVGVGMCGRAELAFILASLALTQGAIDASIFSVLIFTAFLLNLFTPLALKGCAVMLEGRAVRSTAAVGILLPEEFGDDSFLERFEGRLPPSLPKVEDGVVVYGYGPQVESLVNTLEQRGAPFVVIEEDEEVARKLYHRGIRVVHADSAGETLDMQPLEHARSLVLNGTDGGNVLVALSARSAGFEGQIVAMILDPRRRSPMLSAGADVTFAPSHVLAAVLCSRASARINPRVTGIRPLSGVLEIAEIRVHEGSPLAGATLAGLDLRMHTGAHIVGQWRDDELCEPPGANTILPTGAILVAAGAPESIVKLGELARPITSQGPIVLVGLGDVGRKIAEILTSVDEAVCVVHDEADDGVDVVGDLSDPDTLARIPLHEARAVIIALEADSSTVLAATILREEAPELPIVAAADRAGNIASMQLAGVDFALSVGQVSGQLLARHVLKETVSLQPRIRLVRVEAGPLQGKDPTAMRLRERTGCTVVAAQRDGELTLDFSGGFRLESTDALYVCGTSDAIERFAHEFPVERM